MTEKETNTKENTLDTSELREELRGMIREVIESITKEASSKVPPVSTEEPQEDLPTSVRLSEKTEGIAAARFVRAMAAAKGDPERAMKFARQTWDDDLSRTVTRALQMDVFKTGGFLIPESFANEVIDLLRPRNVVRAAGVGTIPMPNGSLVVPRISKDASASYIGETQQIPTSEPEGGQLILSAKKLVSMVPVSNDLLRTDVGDAADMWVRNSIVQAMANREDKAFLRDDGTEYKPKGIRYWSNNVIAMSGSDKEANLFSMMNALAEDDVTGRFVWFMAPRPFHTLQRERTTNGELIFPELRRTPPTLLTFPVFVSNNIPINLGSGSNETEIYLVDMDDAVLAESMDMEVAVDSSASYVTGGTTYSSFQNDLTLVRMITKHDFAMRHAEAACVLTGVTW